MCSIANACAVALEDYNGVGGGRVHKWYQREEFDRQLSRRGVDRATCNERVCVEALKATSGVLKGKPLKHPDMEPYAGPQCFPPIFEDARYLANPEKGSRRAVAADEGGDVLEQLTHCWMRCNNPACGKLRLVERTALASLRDDAYLKGVELDEEWRAWMDLSLIHI